MLRLSAVGFLSGSVQLSGELILPADPRALLVLCHGIPASALSDPGDPGYGAFARAMAERGWGTFCFNFRGCGDAPGDFSMDGWMQDLHAALGALGSHAGELPVVLVGFGAGGAVTIAVAASSAAVSAVVTVATPATLDLAALPGGAAGFLAHCRNTGIIRDPAFPVDALSWVEGFARASALRHIASISPRPLLLMHGDADDVVASLNAEVLFEAAREPKELVRIPGGDHQLRTDPRATDALDDWLGAHF